MNATTKLSLSMLSATALSALVLACTVNTTDGNDNGTVFVPDVDVDSGSTLVCPPNGQRTTIGGDTHPNCQACLNTSCCEQLHQCYDIVPTAEADGSVPSDCETYSQCIDGCNDLSTDVRQICFDACDGSTTPAVLAGYNALQACAGTSCSSATTCEVNTH